MATRKRHPRNLQETNQTMQHTAPPIDVGSPLPSIAESEQSQRVPSLEKMKSLLKLDDIYFRNEIKDYFDDGCTWNEVQKRLWGEDIYDRNNKIDKHLFQIWTKFKKHLRSIYDGIKWDKSGGMHPYLPYYKVEKKDKYKDTPPISRTPSMTPQMGYGTPSNSTVLKGARSSTTDSALHLVDKISLSNRYRSSTIGAHNQPLNRISLIFSTELDDEKDEKKNNPNSNRVPSISPFPGMSCLQSQTSFLNENAAQLTPKPDISMQLSTSPFDIKHIPKMKKMIQSKSKNELRLESSNHACCLIPSQPYRPSLSNGIYGAYITCCFHHTSLNLLEQKCPSFHRIKLMLKTYKELNGKNIMKDIHVHDRYGIQQLYDDFYHVKSLHIDANINEINKCTKCINENTQKAICSYFESEFKCDAQKCIAYTATYRDQTMANEDVAFEQQCHTIHSFFIHSNEKEQIGTTRSRRTENRRYLSIFKPISSKVPSETNELNTTPLQSSPKQKSPKQSSNDKSYEFTYAGQREDQLWWKDVKSCGHKKKKQQSDNDIYKILVKNMGAFRWQNPHGFMYCQNQETMHYQPRFKNIKEEALQNQYEPLSKENWNQVLRKSTIFYNSWTRNKIRTKTQSFFEDQITGQREEWVAGISISKPEIVTLKLYTDYDKLQFALKKCFRFETFDDIFEKKNRVYTMNDNDELKDEEKKQDDFDFEYSKNQLRVRLETFYHWRGALLITLNKYGTKLNGQNNMRLYHGINAKMIVKTSQTFAFSGPLSTTSSYHVARTFATEKGMILEITSQFPRLNYCNAFDVSLISDYPEEQEWLVGFMYVRLLKISTRKLVDNISDWKNLMQRVPVASWMREQFFAIHLFDEQIFSMSAELERILAQFLKVNRFECCKNQTKLYKEQHEYYNDWDMNYMCKAFCRIAHKNNKEIEEKLDDDEYRKKRIISILWQKFDEFRKNPNYRQRVIFDTISVHLKRFFMQQIEEIDINTKQNLWSISFDEIIKVYPNIKEIHFMNEYRFDDCALNNLIKYIENNKTHAIKKIVFLYYNYDQTMPGNDLNMPSNYRIFKDPATLNKDALNKLKALHWEVKHNKNGETGYKIRIYENVKNV